MDAPRRILRREVITICAVIFLADVMSGVVSPTFSLYAQQLGASLTIVGALSSTIGLTRLFTSMPIGMISDRVGRKAVLTVGMVLFSLSAIAYALSPSTLWLFPGRIVGGLAMVSTFFMGIAYVGDIVAPEERGLAFGLYTTSMGLGFTVGPLFGAAVAERYGVAGSYLAAAALTLLGAAIAARGLKRITTSGEAQQTSRRRLPWAGARDMLRHPSVLAGSMGNLMMSVSFGGAVANFFPIYAAQLQVPQVAISSMFSARAFGSTLARLPTGAITSRIPSRVLMYAALALAMGVQFLMAQVNSTSLLGLLLIMEGVAFGSFLTSGQIFVAENCTPETRGTAVGVYSTAGSLGSTVSAIAFGAVADRLGVRLVFRLAGLLILAGLLVIVFLNTRPEPAQLRSELAVVDKAQGAP
jgi:MFS family permease